MTEVVEQWCDVVDCSDQACEKRHEDQSWCEYQDVECQGSCEYMCADLGEVLPG